jgi:hypothetical protein
MDSLSLEIQTACLDQTFKLWKDVIDYLKEKRLLW